MKKKTTKKSGWGGKRDNQTGRPRISDDARVTRSIAFDPATLALLDAYAAEHEISRSAATERLILEGLKDKS